MKTQHNLWDAEHSKYEWRKKEKELIDSTKQ